MVLDMSAQEGKANAIADMSQKYMEKLGGDGASMLIESV